MKSQGGSITKKNYLKTTTLYEQVQTRYLEVCEFCKRIEGRMRKYPEGKIHIVRQGDWVQYYLRMEADDKSGKYISKKEEGKIKLFIQKRYDEAVLVYLKSEKANLEKFLRRTKDNKNKIRNLYSNSPQEVKNMIEPIDISDEDYVAEWLSEQYERKEIAENVPVYITNKGERVRSKSELTIANSLERHGIPYKYECPLLLSNSVTIHPDFTILNVRVRREVYWEHRGMMDDRDYARHAVKRLRELGKEGIISGDNLIITEETSSLPLGTDEIEETIKRFIE